MLPQRLIYFDKAPRNSWRREICLSMNRIKKGGNSNRRRVKTNLQELPMMNHRSASQPNKRNASNLGYRIRSRVV